VEPARRVSFACLGSIEGARLSAPNLVFVFPDQMRGTAMGFVGREPVVTPHLDRFASQSLVLSSVASTFPVCSPYRAMFMTGQYAHRNGVLGNCQSRNAPYRTELRTDARCWSDVLRDQGYSLGYIGKWHLDVPHPPYIDTANNRGDTKWNEWCPPHRRHGFDFWHAYGTYDGHLRPMYWDTTAPREGFRYVDQWGPEYEADLAIRYLTNEGGNYRKSDQPFALVVSMNPPHTPYKAHPPRYLEPYAGQSDEDLVAGRGSVPPVGTPMGDHYRRHIRDYYASITGVDEQFGRILSAINSAGLADDTLVVFTSDHGDCLGAHGHGTKSIWWEESMHVPFIVRLPGRLRAGTDDLLLSTPDIYPTLLGLMGLGNAIPPEVMGCNYAPVLQGVGGPRPRSQLYQWLAPVNPAAGARGVRTHRHTLVLTQDAAKIGSLFRSPDYADVGERAFLFDRERDPWQLHDIAPEQPDLVQALIEQELRPWLTKAEDPFVHPCLGNA
jgi:arylsulfatase A-like enzyme